MYRFTPVSIAARCRLPPPSSRIRRSRGAAVRISSGVYRFGSDVSSSMIASGRILAVSALTASASSAFTTTPSAPFSRSIFIPASLLVIPITSCLAATSAATSGLPMAPLAPATSTFIGFNLPLTTEAQRLAPSLPLRRQDHLYEPIGIEIGLRGLVDLGAGQHLDAVRQIGDSGEIRGIAVFISAGDLVQEVAVVLAVPLEIAQQILVDE